MNEYLLSNRSLGPIITALSAGASDMSGWMLLGLPGAVYLSGLANAWIAIGLSLGAYFNYKYLAKPLRIYTEISNNSITIPDFLENRFKDKTKILRLLSGSLILIFFTLYVSSGIIAGGKTFESFFGLSYSLGAIVTLFIVVFYTFFGGFRAVCLTDAFQGTLMFLVLIAIPVATFFAIGGQENTSQNLNLSQHLNIFHNQSFLGILGLLAWGLGYFGQPHIIVRFMAIKSSQELDKARTIGILWMVLGLVGAILSGILGFIYFSNSPLKDPETVFLKLGDNLFNPFFVGIIISAVLAAIMSTISSQLLISASSVTKDFILSFYKKELSQNKQVMLGRIAVVVVSLIATLIAFYTPGNILSVVGNAWAGFGASFGPVLLFSLYSKKMNVISAFVGMLAGGLSVILWIALGLSSFVYELLPAFIISCVAILITNNLNLKINPGIEEEFEKMKEKMQEDKSKGVQNENK